MTTNVWNIVWRNNVTGNVVETAGGDYRSWGDADAALTTVLGYRRNGLTPTIERTVIEVQS